MVAFVSTPKERVDLMLEVFKALVQGPAVAAYMRPSGIQGNITFKPGDALDDADKLALAILKRAHTTGMEVTNGH